MGVLLCAIITALTACSPNEPVEARRASDFIMSSSSSSSSFPSSASSSSLIDPTEMTSSFMDDEKLLTGPREEFSIPILVYHHVRDTSPWHPSTWSWKMSVSPSNFEEQMQWIGDHGYTTITLDELAQILDGTLYGPEKPIVITFDDNQMSAYDIAVPIMHARGQAATFYLIAKYLDDPNFIGTAQIPDLIEKGMDIQSHTMTHANLTNLSRDQLVWQLAESKRVLEEITGRPVHHIAYPLTAHNATVRAAAKEAGYITGTIMDPRPVRDGADPMKLPRIMMTDTTDLAKILP